MKTIVLNAASTFAVGLLTICWCSQVSHAVVPPDIVVCEGKYVNGVVTACNNPIACPAGAPTCLFFPSLPAIPDDCACQ